MDPRYESSDFTYQDFINAAHAKGLKVIQDVVFNHTGNFGETNLFPMIEKQGDLSSSDCMKLLPNSGLPTDYNQLLPARQYDARIEKVILNIFIIMRKVSAGRNIAARQLRLPEIVWI